MSSAAWSYAPIGGAEEVQEASSAPCPSSRSSDPFDALCDAFSQAIDFMDEMIARQDAEIARIAGEIARFDERRRRRSDA